MFIMFRNIFLISSACKPKLSTEKTFVSPFTNFEIVVSPPPRSVPNSITLVFLPAKILLWSLLIDKQ